MTTQDKLLSALGSLDPSDLWDMMGRTLRTFDKMGICEDEIAKARRRHPDYDVALWNAFKLLMPNKLLHEVPDPVYRAHCRELLDRVAGGLDTTLGTKAEIMMILAKTSLAYPLPHGKAVVYARLFQEILPNTLVAEDVAQLAAMTHDSEIEREMAYLAQATRVPDRKPKEEKEGSEWRTPPSQ